MYSAAHGIISSSVSILHVLLHHPRRLFLRRALFQIHLWAGVLLSLYVVVIALSGAVLVFEDELTAITLPSGLHIFDPSQTVGMPAVAARFRHDYPAATLSSITVPTSTIPAYQLRASGASGLVFNLAADPQTAELHPLPHTWVEWVHNLHVYLLLPSAYGAQVNGVGAAILMLLTLSGIALWWPGLRTWMRGLRVNFGRNWRRVNFELHNAIGFWTLALVFWWSFSGVYFGFYRQVAAAVNLVSPVRNMNAPRVLPASKLATRLTLPELLQRAQQASPTGHLYSMSDPLLHGSSIYVDMDLARSGDFSHRDIVVLDTATGRVLSLWHYADRLSLGDWILWLMHPLHFGTLWGLPGKLLWATIGVSLALLSLTGLLMYWNRFLRHRWSILSHHGPGA